MAGNSNPRKLKVLTTREGITPVPVGESLPMTPATSRRRAGIVNLACGNHAGRAGTRIVYWAVAPPSMTNSLPVMNDDSSEAKNRTP